MEGVEFADVEQSQVGFVVTQECATLAVLQVEVDDAEAIGHLVEERKGGRADDVDAAESQRTAFVAAHLASLDTLPARQSHLVVKLQIALRLSVADEQQRIDGGIGSSRTRGQIIEPLESHIT